MADRHEKGPREPDPVAAAKDANARFQALSAEIRGSAILGPGGLLAATGDPDGWTEAAERLLAAADAAAAGLASHAHIATEEGEAYLMRHAGLVMVAVTDRFALASLVLADMRAALRELAGRGASPVPEAA